MLEIYILIGIVALILCLVAWAKVNSARAKASDIIAQSAINTAKAKEAVIAQKAKTEKAVIAVKEALQVKQQSAQAEIDTGKREDFSGDSF